MKRQDATPDVDIPTINVGLVSKGSINVSESIYVSQQVLDVKEYMSILPMPRELTGMFDEVREGKASAECR